MASEYAAIFTYTEEQNEPPYIDPTLLKLPNDELEKIAVLKKAFIELAGDEATTLEDLSFKTTSSLTKEAQIAIYGDYEITDGSGTHLIATIVIIPE